MLVNLSPHLALCGSERVVEMATKFDPCHCLNNGHLMPRENVYFTIGLSVTIKDLMRRMQLRPTRSDRPYVLGFQASL